MIMTEKKRLVLIFAVLAAAVFVVAFALLSGTFFKISLSCAEAAGEITVTGPTAPEPFTYGTNTAELRVEAVYSGEVRYQWYFKGADDDDYGVLPRENRAVYAVRRPDQSGSYFCRVSDAADGSIYCDSRTIQVTVYKMVVNIKIDDKTSVYGEDTVPLTFTRLTPLVAGDTENELGITLKKADGDEVGSYAITGDFISELYAPVFRDGVYEIKKRPINVTVADVSSVYGEPIKELSYEIKNENQLIEGDAVEDLNITLTKESGADAGKYAINGACDSKNYEVVFSPATYEIKPKEVDVRLVGINELVYSGVTPDIVCEVIGADKELTATVTFDKAVRNAGDYVAYVRTDDKNYKAYNSEIPFTVAKASLKITFEDAIIKVGETFNPIFIYDGFVNGENEEVLRSLPTLSPALANAGKYKLLPFGASADNYEISYIEGNLQINVDVLRSDNVELKGSFAPDSTLTVGNGNSAEGVSVFKKKHILSVVTDCTDIKTDGVHGEYTATLKNGKKYFPLFMRACIVDEDGNKVVLKSYGEDKDGNFTFTADEAGTLVIYYSLIVPLIILAVLILIILIIIIFRVRDKKRYNRARIGHSYARQYADAVVKTRRK